MNASRSSVETEPAETTLTPFEIISAFSGDFTPVKTPFGYGLGLALAALVFMTLPVVYALLTAGVTYAVYWHAAHDWFIPTGRSMALLFVAVYLAPLVAGAILVIFMLKPFFVLPAGRPVPLYLNPAKQPLIFAFVREICQMVKAPVPRKIAVTCHANAAAGFRRGMWSMVVGGDLVLYIGLPLASAFTLRQFAGVVAHEMGHFSQGSAMRFSYLAQRGCGWFAERIVSGDSWDLALDRFGRGQEEWYVQLTIFLARAMIWLARRILWGVFLIGRVAVSFLVRRMELHADRFALSMAGHEAVSEFLRRFPALGVADEHAHAAALYGFLQGQLPNDLPGLIMAFEQSISPDDKAHLERHVLRAPTGLFDTHPAITDRILAGNAHRASPAFSLEGPASSLFRDFPGLCRMATRDYYYSFIGPAAGRFPQCDVPAFLETTAALLSQVSIRRGR